MRLVRATSHPLLLANGCALSYVTFIPFPTAVLAAHLAGPEVRPAVALDCGTFVLMDHPRGPGDSTSLDGEVALVPLADGRFLHPCFDLVCRFGGE